jgi:hypothetical protein
MALIMLGNLAFAGFLYRLVLRVPRSPRRVGPGSIDA